MIDFPSPSSVIGAAARGDLAVLWQWRIAALHRGADTHTTQVEGQARQASPKPTD